MCGRGNHLSQKSQMEAMYSAIVAVKPFIDKLDSCFVGLAKRRAV